MVRGLICGISILGIVLCPLKCGELDETPSAPVLAVFSDHGCGFPCDGTPLENSPNSSESHEGCHCQCICKGVVFTQVDFSVVFVSHYLAISDNPVAGSAVFTPCCGELPALNETHPHLYSGVCIRLLFSSLLI